MLFSHSTRSGNSTHALMCGEKKEGKGKLVGVIIHIEGAGELLQMAHSRSLKTTTSGSGVIYAGDDSFNFCFSCGF